MCIWATDIGAYFVGRTAGGARLAPRISRDAKKPDQEAQLERQRSITAQIFRDAGFIILPGVALTASA